jgi:hypothetical protein
MFDLREIKISLAKNFLIKWRLLLGGFGDFGLSVLNTGHPFWMRILTSYDPSIEMRDF